MIKKRLLILLIGLISFSMLEFQYIHYLINTPKDSIYLGTVHFPPDYFSYLSYIVQGKDHLLSSTALYTSEKTPLVLVRWQFVLIGKLLSIFPLNTGQMYQIAVVIFTISFMAAGYILISLLLKKYEEKILAFLFFVSSTAWPIFQMNNGKLNFSYHYYWFNTGDFFTRFGPTPNHLLGSALLTCGFILILHWCRRIQARLKIPHFIYNSSFALIALTLASLSPMHWILFLGSITGLLIIIACRALIIEKIPFWHILNYFQPVLFTLIGGLSATLYLLSVYKTFPYNIGNSWEAIQQVFMDFPNLFYGSGIVILFAVIGCYSYFRHNFFNPEKLATLFFISISLAFFFTDLPWKLGTSNVRYWPEGIYVFIAVLASHGVFFLAGMAKRARYLVLIILILLYLSTTVPTFIAGIKERSNIIITNSFYLPKTIYDVYGYASRTIKRPSIFLLPWPYDYTFPAFTGQKSFTGHPLSHMTINADKKYALSAQFFSAALDEKKAREILIQNGIQYILSPDRSSIEKYNFLKKLYSRGEAAVFEVK
ncbi:hypothetical protein HY338_02115 [Candidatus Gottesmanbacteria bacterium]|nr:hypothetical protein [Candidatus Gottesmanbacteria bacterium]